PPTGAALVRSGGTRPRADPGPATHPRPGPRPARSHPRRTGSLPWMWAVRPDGGPGRAGDPTTTRSPATWRRTPRPRRGSRTPAAGTSVPPAEERPGVGASPQQDG